MKKVFAAILFVLTIFVTYSQSHAKENVTVIFTTTDIHGHVYEVPERGEIGYALLKAYINSTKADTKILTDTGDNFAGNSLTLINLGHFAANLMGLMKYDMMTIGNHEFDYNSAKINGKTAGDGHIASLINTVRKHNKSFKGLAANLYHKDIKTGKFIPVSEWDSVFGKVIVRNIEGFTKDAKDKDGRPIGKLVFIGITTDEIKTLRKTASKNVENFETDDTKTSIEFIESIANEYAGNDNIVIAAVHMGMPEELTAALIKNKNIDFILDGHSHIKSSEIIETENTSLERAYINNGSYLKAFSEITILSENGKIIKAEARQNDYEYISSLELVPDAEIAQAITAVRKGNPLFEMWADLLPSEKHDKETAIGRVIAKTIAEVTKSDIGVINTGAIRTGLKKGTVYMLDIYDIYPFIDTVIVAEMTGRELEEMLIDAFNRGNNALPNIYGVKIKISPDGKLAEKAIGVEYEKKYRVAMNGFMATGGDHYPIQKNTSIECWLDGKTKQTDNCPFADSIASSLQRHGKDFFEDAVKTPSYIMQ